MQLLFACTLSVYLVISLHSIFVGRRIIGVNLFVLLGIYLPMLLWQLNWSQYVDTLIHDDFYIVFIYLNIILIIFNCVITDNVRIDSSLFHNVRSCKISAVHAMNVVYLLLFFYESYLGSGSLAPARLNIDIHTYSAPGIAFITRNLFVFVLVDVITYFVTKRKIFIVWGVILLAVPVVTRSMRISVLIALIQVATFVVLVISSRVKNKNGLSIKGKIAVIAGSLLAIAAIISMALLTSSRMKYNGDADTYEGRIAYTGPEFGVGTLSVYYGYFPLSFNNLNLTLRTGIQPHSYWGLYSFRVFYFGLCQLDNLFGIDAYAPDSLMVYSTGAALVTTGFYEYFYDYGVLCFIPIAVMITICWYLTRQMQKSPSLFCATQYCCFVPLILFESFQNVFFGDVLIWGTVAMFILLRFLFTYEDEDYDHESNFKYINISLKQLFPKKTRDKQNRLLFY